MSLDSTLRGLAAEIGKNRTPTGAEAAPAKLRHRTGTIDAYTAGALTASVQVGADVVDAPFVGSYTPAAGDAVSVLINNGSPLILGAVNKLPVAAGGGIVGSADFMDPGHPAFAASFDPSALNTSDGDVSALAYNPTFKWVDLLLDGWYQVNVSAVVTGCAVGDHLEVDLVAGGLNFGTVRGQWTATSTGSQTPNATSPVFYSHAIDGNGVTGKIVTTGSTGTVSFADVYVAYLGA